MKILISIIIAVAFLTRFFQLGTFPAQLNIDEVAMGYSAYSILKTGHDEWGRFLPISFASVGDYKTPIPIYLMAISESIFGLNQFGIRFIPALFSFLAVLIYFYIGQRYLFKASKISPILLLLLSFSPWSIFFSRYGYEVNELLFWFGIYLLVFIRFLLKPKPWHILSLGLIYLVCSLTYNPAKLFIPVFTLTVWLNHLYHHKLSKEYLRVFFHPLTLLSLIIIISLFVPFAKTHLLGEGAMRAKSVFIANDYEYAKVIIGDIKNIALFELNSFLLLIMFWWRRILEYLSPNFYLFTGLQLTSPEQFGVGVSNLVEYFFFALGIWSLIRSTKSAGEFFDRRFIILSWFFLGFLPASLANNSQQPLRSLISYPPYIFICFEGLMFLITKTKSISIYILISIVYLFGLMKFADYYLIHFPVQLYESKHYGWQDVARFVASHAKDYDQVIVDPRFGRAGPYIVGVPHLYFLYQSNYDPAHYQDQIATQSGRTNFDNIYFENINWFSYDHSKNTLFVGSPWSIPLKDISREQILFSVKYLDGYEGLLVVRNSIK